MNRFWIFPLVLGLMGVLLPLAMLTAAAAPEWYRAPNGRVGVIAGLSFYLPLLEVWSLRLFVLGALFGFGVALWDWLHNRRRDPQGWKTSARLIGNSIWCGVYALAVMVMTDALLIALLKAEGVPKTLSSAQEALFIVWPTTAAIGMLLSATLWATIRTITTDDVLSPRVLVGKMRHSVKLEG